MAEKGQVIEMKDDLVVIKMTRTEACAKCRACVAGLTEREMIMEAENHCDAQIGDWVELSMIESGFFSAVLIMYGIPLIGFMAGLLSTYFLIMPKYFPESSSDLPSFFVGLIGTGIAYLWIRSQEDRWKQRKYKPIASCITTDEPETM